MVLRGRFYYHRRRLPSELVAIAGRAEVWISLRTDSRKEAFRRFPAAAAQVEARIEKLRAQAGLTVDQTLIQPWKCDDADKLFGGLTSSQVEPQILDRECEADPPLTLVTAYQLYVDDPIHSWTISTRRAYETTRALVVGILGEGKIIRDLRRPDVRQLVEVLRFLPLNAGKLYPDLTPRQAVEQTRSIDGIKRISAANANAYLGNFCTFLNWALKEELLDRNPARGLRLPDNVLKRDKRHPFSPSQLKSIFEAPLYTGCVDGERKYKEVGSERPQNARYWVPLIALHTGMRLNEICQLDARDIRLVDSVPCIRVTNDSDCSDDKTLKTKASDRLIPLHPTLINLGIIAYAKKIEDSGEVKLFADIPSGPNGRRAIAFSKWFTQFLNSAGAKQRRSSFHSFRHNFRDELRCARIEHDVAMALGGWVGGPSVSSVVSENYGSGLRAEVLQQAINRMKFSDVDLSHLR